MLHRSREVFGNALNRPETISAKIKKETMSFNWEADTEPLEDRYCECGQHYKIDLYPGADEGHYAVTARPVIHIDSDTEYQTLDDDKIIEGPVSEEAYRVLSANKPVLPVLPAYPSE